MADTELEKTGGCPVAHGVAERYARAGGIRDQSRLVARTS